MYGYVSAADGCLGKVEIVDRLFPSPMIDRRNLRFLAMDPQEGRIGQGALGRNILGICRGKITRSGIERNIVRLVLKRALWTKGFYMVLPCPHGSE